MVEQDNGYVLVDPETPPPPTLSPGIRRTYEVEAQGRIHPFDCLVSVATGGVYGVIRTLRPSIFGKVKQGVCLEQRNGSYRVLRDRLVAIKIIKKELLGRRSQENPLREISVMQHLAADGGGGHPNVLGLLEALQDDHNIYLVLPFCDGGEICQWFERSRFMMKEDVARGFFRQMLSGLQFLHARGVVHRDISLENLLYDERSRRCIIIDLGMCLKLPRPADPNVVVRRQGQVSTSTACMRKRTVAWTRSEGLILTRCRPLAVRQAGLHVSGDLRGPRLYRAGGRPVGSRGRTLHLPHW
jgi:serine/threonine protein kinase